MFKCDYCGTEVEDDQDSYELNDAGKYCYNCWEYWEQQQQQDEHDEQERQEDDEEPEVAVKEHDKRNSEIRSLDAPWFDLTESPHVH